MPDCPHCSAAIEHLPGFISQAKLTERLAAKDVEIKQYADRVTELAPKAEGHAALVAAAADWQAKYETVVQVQERTELLGSMSISADKLPGIEQLWQSAQASKAEAERAPFGDWLQADDGAKAHPLLGSLFAPAAPAAAAAAPVPGTPPAPSALPRQAGPVLAPAPPAQGGMTPADAARYFASPAYRALPPADQKIKLAEMQAAVQSTTP